MGTTGNMPPQAYTREMLAQAFDWLKGQPQYIRERATTADGLVSMYLQSRKTNAGNGQLADRQTGLAAGIGSGSGLEAPSVESFKSDLRNLAENMKSFESTASFETPVIRPPITHHTPKTTVGPTVAVNELKPETATVTATVTTPRPIEPKHTYDSQTMEAIQTVRQKLNLSNDSEALRMLVKLGFEKVRSILS